MESNCRFFSFIKSFWSFFILNFLVMLSKTLHNFVQITPCFAYTRYSGLLISFLDPKKRVKISTLIYTKLFRVGKSWVLTRHYLTITLLLQCLFSCQHLPRILHDMWFNLLIFSVMFTLILHILIYNGNACTLMWWKVCHKIQTYLGHA